MEGSERCLYENGRQRQSGKVTVRYGRSSGRRKRNAEEDAEGGNAVNGFDFIFSFSGLLPMYLRRPFGIQYGTVTPGNITGLFPEFHPRKTYGTA